MTKLRCGAAYHYLKSNERAGFIFLIIILFCGIMYGDDTPPGPETDTPAPTIKVNGTETKH